MRLRDAGGNAVAIMRDDVSCGRAGIEFVAEIAIASTYRRGCELFELWGMHF